MARCRYTSQAELELHGIWVYIAKNSVSAADHTLEQIMATCQKLADEPGLGQVYEQLPPLRLFPIGSYIVFYRRTDDGIEVVHVIHGARDYPSLFLFN